MVVDIVRRSCLKFNFDTLMVLKWTEKVIIGAAIKFRIDKMSVRINFETLSVDNLFRNIT